MTLIDVEGGDHLANTMFIAKGWDQNPTLGMTAGRVRGQSWEMTGNGGATSMSKVLPSTYSSVVLGIGFRYDIRPPFSTGTTASLPLLTLASSAGAAIASVSTNCLQQAAGHEQRRHGDRDRDDGDCDEHLVLRRAEADHGNERELRAPPQRRQRRDQLDSGELRDHRDRQVLTYDSDERSGPDL